MGLNEIQVYFDVVIEPDGLGGYAKGIAIRNFEGVNPVIWIRDSFVQFKRYKQGEIVAEPKLTDEEVELWEKHYRDIQALPISTNFVKLFDSSSKSGQETLLRGQTLTSKQLTSLFCYAGERFGYKMSLYRFEHYPNIFTDKKWPKVFHLREDGSFTKIGETDLNDAQLLQILKQRKIVFAKILASEDRWYCFYYTEKAYSGTESSGVKHVHFISNYWTIPLDNIVQELQKRNYSFNGLHLSYE